MKCDYDDNPFACFSCPFNECERDDIKKDVIKDLAETPVRKREKYRLTYEKTDAAYKERLRRKKLGLPMPERVYKCKGRRAEYQREYRASMSEEQHQRYLEWQRNYQRAYRERLKNEPNVSVV